MNLYLLSESTTVLQSQQHESRKCKFQTFDIDPVFSRIEYGSDSTSVQSCDSENVYEFATNTFYIPENGILSRTSAGNISPNDLIAW